MPSIKKVEYERLLTLEAERNQYRDKVVELEAGNRFLRDSLREFDDMRREVETCRRAVQVERMRYAQYQRMLDVYQNLILDWYAVQANPPMLMLDVAKVDIPNCLKPFDSIKYLFRDEDSQLTGCSQGD